MMGKIFVNDRPMDKPGAQISSSDRIELRGDDMPYVSRGGIKLEAALDAFGIHPSGFVCIDVGASTGGFTDCLLQRGAVKVYAVDVGYGQLAWKLRTDSRVIPYERTNIRYLDRELLTESADLITVDVSFISLKIVVPCVMQFLSPNGTIVALIKPQFEVGKGMVGKGGVVKDTRLHESVVRELSEYFSCSGLGSESVIPSPIRGPKGNKEFFIHLTPD